MARTKGPAYKMKSAAHGGPMQKNFPSVFKKTTEPTEAELIAQAEARFGEGVEVKAKETRRDVLAEKIKRGSTTPQGVKPGMEQSAKSSDYKRADEILVKEGDKEAKERLANRAKRVAEVKKAYANNPNMSQAEIDKMMSQR